MGAELRPAYPGHHRRIFQCDCDDAHYLIVEWDEDEEHEAAWLTLVLSLQPTRIRERVVSAMKALLGRQHTVEAVILRDGDVDDLTAVLQSSAIHNKRRAEAGQRP